VLRGDLRSRSPYHGIESIGLTQFKACCSYLWRLQQQKLITVRITNPFISSLIESRCLTTVSPYILTVYLVYLGSLWVIIVPRVVSPIYCRLITKFLIKLILLLH